MNTADAGTEITFELTRDDYVALVDHLARTDLQQVRARQDHRLRITWICVAWIAQAFLAAVGVMWLLLDRGDGIPVGPVLALAAALAVFSTSMLVSLVRQLGSMPADDVLNGMIDAYAFGPRRVSLTPEGVWLRSTALDVLNRWMAVDCLDQTSELLIIRARSPLCTIVPRRAFATPEACKEFIFAFDRFKTGDTEGINLLAAYLAGRDAACLSCGYNLRDQRTPKCPECGTIMELNALRAANAPPPLLLPERPDVEAQ